MLENDLYDWEKCSAEDLLTINAAAATAQQLTRLTPAYLGSLQPKPLPKYIYLYNNYHYIDHFFSPALGHLFFFLTCLFLHSMANASVLPGELQRENTEDVLQGERLSDADICPPLPMPAPPVNERGEWEEGDNAPNRKQTAPIIRKVRGISGYPAVLWRVWPDTVLILFPTCLFFF